ncbi:hypothetical protein [Prevotella sp. E2-28]|uniref:hypothetical protein n=1 Tax=Prevotella sp. E2-28 TaxID=2913620 RepID=UPI001EDA70FA|nr:hypothetical protein [Prevotella sp. E2-28]UKK52692.1 hypothetical protein L6465_08750 [Prevotella sp. E2-28]
MTVFKCIVTLKNGSHTIKRFNRDIVEKLAYAFRCKQRDPWLRERYANLFKSLDLIPQLVTKLLFINEYTGERLELA